MSTPSLSSPPILRFCLVGAAGTLVNVSAFALVAAVAAPGRPVAGAIAFLVSAAHNFAWHRGWTFRARRAPALRQASRFVTVAAIGLGTQLLGLQLITAATHLPVTVAQTLAVLAVTPVTFVASRDWAFRLPGTAAGTRQPAARWARHSGIAATSAPSSANTVAPATLR